jgi:hypothetical protein
MWPSLLVLGIGRRRRLPVPLPLFLAWPIVGAGWAVVGLAGFVAPGATRRPGAFGTLRTGLTLFNQIRGTRIDIDDSNGTHVHLRLV